MTSPGLIHVASDAFDLAARAARRARGRETGGALIGFRSGSDIHVRDVLVVPDSEATRTRYVLREDQRERELERYLSHLAHGSLLGYVGTWHSHPAPCGPSFVDRQTFRRELWSARGPIALLVLAAEQMGWVLHGMTGSPRLRCRVTDVVVA